MTTDTTRRLEPHELKVALRPGLFPDLATAPNTVGEWDGLDDLREQHVAALADYTAALDALAQQQAASPSQANVKQRREAEAAARHTVVAEVTRIVWEARDLLEDWRSVEDDTEAARRAEVEQLYARLQALTTEDVMLERLAVWLNRLDPERITTGIYPWAQLAQAPVPPDRPVGPIAQALQH
jgi:hypothetical protein